MKMKEKTNNKHRIVGMIALIALVSMLAACSSTTGNVIKEETIKIGFIEDLSGPAVSYGLADQRIVKMALEDIKNDKTLGNMNLEVIFEDGGCSGEQALTAAQKLIYVDDVEIILGGSCSSETLAFAPIAESNEVVVLSSMSTHPDITDSGDYIFRNVHSDIQSARQVAEYAFAQGDRKIAVIVEQNDYPKGYAEYFSKRFEELGGEIVSEESYKTEDREFSTQVTKVLAKEPDAIAIFALAQTGGQVAKSIYEAGFHDQLYGSTILGDAVTLKEFGPYVQGVIYADAKGLDQSNPEVEEFKARYETMYGEELPSDYFHAAKYDAVQIIAQAIKEVGTDSIKIKNYLYELESYEGLIGTYSFDEHGDVEGIDFEIRKVTGEGTIPLN